MSITQARTLRRNMTDAERKLWWLFRSRVLGDYKFRRQHPVGRYVTDFACVEAALIVEVDGGQHCENANDGKRTAWLESCGWRVLRFWNNEVLQQTEAVLETLAACLESTLTRPASPVDLSHRGEANARLLSGRTG